MANIPHRVTGRCLACSRLKIVSSRTYSMTIPAVLKWPFPGRRVVSCVLKCTLFTGLFLHILLGRLRFFRAAIQITNCLSISYFLKTLDFPPGTLLPGGTRLLPELTWSARPHCPDRHLSLHPAAAMKVLPPRMNQ